MEDIKGEKTDNELIEAFWVSQGGKPHLPEDVWFYESDWNMLMTLVEKIESLGYYTRISTGGCWID